MINQASSWGLIQSLSTADATDYLDALKQRGFNTVLVSIISYDIRMAGNPPFWQGISPFSTQWDYSTYNEAYFAHADEVINLAKARGMLVMLVPSYLGYAGEPTQGWFDEMLGSNNSVAKSLAYGRFLGQRYKDFTNIIWVAGGDNTPAAGSELENRLKAIIDGIRESDSHLWTGHWDSVGHGNGVMATENPTFASYMNINGYYAYNYDPTYQRDLEFYNKQPVMMMFHLDQSYEGEPGGTVENIRRKAYDVMLSGGAGSSFCAGQNWWGFFNWRTNMNTPGTLQTQLWYRLFSSRSWWDLVPDQTHVVVTSGLGNVGFTDYVAAARTSNGSTVMAFIPSGRTVTVDMTKVSGTQAKAWWFNPSNGQSTLIGSFPTTATKSFATPDNNDWLLVIDDAAQNLAAPGTTSTTTISYSTDFNGNEKPLSEGGAWSNNGIDWTPVAVANGYAFGTQPSGSPAFDDSISVLSGFPPNQSASAVIHVDGTLNGGTHEVEILLHFSISPHDAHGYECNLSFGPNSSYTEIVRWNGPLGSYDYVSRSNSVAPHENSVFTATIVGNTITVTLDGTVINTVDITSIGGSVWSTGNPGVGFWHADNAPHYAFTSFSATSL